MKKSTYKTLLRIISVLLLVIAITTFTSNVVFAEQITPNSLTPTYNGSSTEMTNKAGKIMGIIRNVSVVAAVIIIMIIGVKYILGSVEEKAEYKKTFMPLIIGIVLVVSATTIASFIFSNAE